MTPDNIPRVNLSPDMARRIDIASHYMGANDVWCLDVGAVCGWPVIDTLLRRDIMPGTGGRDNG